MVKIKTITAAALTVIAHAAVAQTCTTVPLGGGFTSTSCSNGASYTAVPLGGGLTSTTCN